MEYATLTDYAPPTVEVIGTLEELTLVKLKGRRGADAFGQQRNIIVSV